MENSNTAVHAARRDGPPAAAAPGRAASTPVWDWPVRVFHWSLVVLLAGAWITAEGPVTWMVWHQRVGYAVLALLLFRVMWGLWGSYYARFASFVRGPRAVWRYAVALARRRVEPHIGHNPLGGWVVLLMLALLGVQTGSGLFASDEILVDGPLRDTVSRATSKLLTRIHHVNFNLLLAVVGVHITAAFGYWLVLRQNLIVPMLTGRKQVAAPTAPVQAVPWWRAVLTALAAVGAVWWLVR